MVEPEIKNSSEGTQLKEISKINTKSYKSILKEKELNN